MDSDIRLSGNSSYNGDMQRLKQIRSNAAEALKRINAVYESVMNCEGKSTLGMYFDDDFSSCLDTDSIITEDAFSIRSGSLPSSVPNNLYSTESLCAQCRNPSVPHINFYQLPKFVPRCDKCHHKLHAQDCLMANSYITNLIDVQPLVEHPTEHRLKKMCNVTKEQKTASNHMCPLKATVPEPFEMTLRDEQRREQRDLKLKLLKEEIEEDILKETHIKIYSKPVPLNTQLPLYKMMTELKEQTKLNRKLKAAENVQKHVKPFNFISCHEKTNSKSKSMTDLSKEGDKIQFRAKPAPVNILSTKVSENLKKKEILRKYTINQRAQELLKQASVPFSTRSRTLTRSFSFVNLQKQDEKKGRPRSCSTKLSSTAAKAMTNQQWLEVTRSWNSKVTSMVVLQKAKQQTKAQVTSEKGMTKVDVSKSVGIPLKPMPFYDVPIRQTNATILREKKIRQENSRKKLEMAKTDATGLVTEKEVRDQLLAHLNLDAKNYLESIDHEMEEKLKNFRASRRERQQEYERELLDIKRRILKQPLLFERQIKRVVTTKLTTEKTDSLTDRAATHSVSNNEDSIQHASDDNLSEELSMADDNTKSASENEDQSESASEDEKNQNFLQKNGNSESSLGRNND